MTIDARARHLRPLAAALVLAAVTASACARAGGDDARESIVVGAATRTYVLHVPDGLTGRVPLVISFHGHGGDGAGQTRLTGFDALADRYGFIVAYPDGIDRGWNDGRPQTAKNGDDLAYAAALVDELQRRYPIDPHRIYATGFSNGAIFSNYLACNQSERFAAIAPVSGMLPVADVPQCRPKRPLSVLEIGGTSDPIVPYSGGEVVVAGAKRGEVLSEAATAAFWAKNAGCAPNPETTALPQVTPADGTSITRSTFADCRDGTSVVQYTVIGGGHAWPGGPQYLPAFLIGTASRQLDASQVIVQFFLAHPMQ